MRKNESASSLFERKPTKQFDTPLNLYPNKLHAWMKWKLELFHALKLREGKLYHGPIFFYIEQQQNFLAYLVANA